MKTKKEMILGILLLALLPLISAFDSTDLIDSQWFMFTVVFVFFFAVVYFSSFKTFDENRAITGIISGAVALVASIALTKRTVVYTMLPEETANLLFLIGAAIAIFFAIKYFAFRRTPYGDIFSLPRVIFGVIIIGILLAMTDFYSVLPEYLYFGPVGDILNTVKEIFTDLFIWIVLFGIGFGIFKVFKKKPQNGQ
jgi:hypothetical protein